MAILNTTQENFSFSQFKSSKPKHSWLSSYAVFSLKSISWPLLGIKPSNDSPPYWKSQSHYKDLQGPTSLSQTWSSRAQTPHQWLSLLQPHWTWSRTRHTVPRECASVPHPNLPSHRRASLTPSRPSEKPALSTLAAPRNPSPIRILCFLSP